MDLISRFLAVLAVLGCLLLLIWLLRRAGVVSLKSSNGTRFVELVERTPCGPHLSIHVIRVAGTHLVIAVHSSGVTVLERIPSS